MADMATAIHEAAHAVVAMRLGLSVAEVSVLPGHGLPAYMTYADRPTAVRRAMVQLAAGAAVRDYLGEEDEGDHGDLQKAWAAAAAAWPDEDDRLAYLNALRRRVRRLLALPQVRRAVKRVAEALIERGRLSGRQVRRLVEGR
jgi:hypothetical protein